MSIQESSLTPAGQCALAGISTLITNGAVHPLCTVKNRYMDNQRPLIPSLRWLYRGYGSICAAESTHIAFLYVVDDLLKQRHFHPLTSSVIAGVLSSPIVTVGEGIMVNQQNHQISLIESVRRSLRISGLFATVLREVPYSIAICYWSPALQRRRIFSNEWFNQLFAGCVSGSVAGFLTGPCDLLKTVVQSNDISLREAIRNVVREGLSRSGRRKLLISSSIRSGYVGLAVAILNISKNQLPSTFPSVLKEQ